MRNLITLGLCGLAAATLAGEDPFVAFTWQGGRSPYKSVQVTINAGGATEVFVAKRDGPVTNYATKLSRNELGALRETIAAVKFFSRPDEDELRKLDGGRTTLTIRLGEQERTIACAHCAGLDPVAGMMWQLVAQGEAVWALEHDGDIYIASGAVNAQLAGRKALQPAQLKEPLRQYIATHEDRQRVEWALTGLAFVTTAEELAAIVAKGLEKPGPREVLLTITGSHPFTGNIPAEHGRALCPLYLAFVRDARGRQDKLTKAEAQALTEFTRMLGELRYAPAIPMFKTWFEAHQKPYVDGSFTPLAKMGLASLEALIPYLRSENENYRLNAVELLVIASRGGPRAGFSNPLPAEEYARMIPMFTDTVLPRLVEMAERDTSAKVKAKAGQAAEEIQKHVKE
jgi:hypothetical protein